jgi:S1-C subfamily serine protease
MENMPESKNTFDALSDDLTQAVDKVSRSVVAVNARRHLSSSGVYWRDGIVVTAAHTVRRTEEISVILPSRQTAAATFAGADPSTDLAILKVDSQELSVPDFGQTFQLKVGHLVVAVGRGAQRGLSAGVVRVERFREPDVDEFW